MVFPCSVAAHEGDSFSAGDAGGEVADNFVLSVGFAQMFDFEDVFARGALLLEFDVRALDVGFCQFCDLQTLDFFPAGLDLAGASAGGEFGDEFV